MVTARGGGSSLGCLTTLLIVAALTYFGVNAGEHYFRYFEFQDAMRQEIRFAAHNSDAQILRTLRAKADSLGLPEAAGEVTLQRDGRHVSLQSEYYVQIELPLFVREVRFSPHAEGVF